MPERQDEPPVPWPEAAPGEHVYLSYAYLNARDYDAFASLLELDAVVSVPGEMPACGRAAVVAAERRRRFRYSIQDLWIAQGRIVTTGVLYRQEGCARGVDFADICMMSAYGLIASRRTYISASPTEGTLTSG
ncbi:hypothetical protein ACFU5O_34330 [Streptomyces sp. NPDC057445]|uniref:hypothetical protein n=1 Tax=Streptomyces sp. NPDC057445 TaxID=3346136 RepID=UPI0036913155